jgi:hypothetical protein
LVFADKVMVDGHRESVQSTKVVKVGESFLRREQYIIVEILKLNTIIYKGLLFISIY